MNNNILGISAGYHDAGATVVDGNTGDILFASHSERFSKKKHDKDICDEILTECRKYGDIKTVAYYENHWLKKLRQFRSGEGIKWSWSLKDELKRYHFNINRDIIENANEIVSFSHHKSHAAAGFQTSPYDNATVVVIDAIGEFDTITIWDAWYDNDGNAQYKKIWSLKYPDSIGLFYSAYTKYVGLRPLDEEYILMGMAAYGDKDKAMIDMVNYAIQSFGAIHFKQNFQIGAHNDFYDATDFDIAAAAQCIVEKLIYQVMLKAKAFGKSSNLVYMGGVALNCSANSLLGKHYDNIWIMPNPGDAGSSLGAAALAYGKKLNWHNAYLGFNISGKYPVDLLIAEFIKTGIAGVANGRAEFGPRALGNRSLLADPRGSDIKDRVNEIKRRQKFRPFAPVILEEYVHDYFTMPAGFRKSNYMQVTAVCTRPDEFPAIVHADGTSRVQTVPKDNSGIRQVLEKWYDLTGCPMLLNTSLNIRGEPMVNSRADAMRFELEYGVKVFMNVL